MVVLAELIIVAHLHQVVLLLAEPQTQPVAQGQVLLAIRVVVAVAASTEERLLERVVPVAQQVAVQ
jgi:hypothetical protein